MDPATGMAATATLIDEPRHELTDDEALVAGCSLPFLITASTTRTVETIARRVHAASSRRGSPFVRQRSGALPRDQAPLDRAWSTLTQAARGGSLLLFAIEETPPSVQGRLIDLLAEIHAAGDTAPVRFIAGTTASLGPRIARGAFSDSLFYRLNLVHLVAGRRAQGWSRRGTPSADRPGGRPV